MTREAFHIHILPGMPVTREAAMRLRKEPTAWQWHEWKSCPNCITPWKCNGPHEPQPRHR